MFAAIEYDAFRVWAESSYRSSGGNTRLARFSYLPTAPISPIRLIRLIRPILPILPIRLIRPSSSPE
jgi:hypothetical protein